MSENIFAERNPLSRRVKELESQLTEKDKEVEWLRQRIIRFNTEINKYLNRLQEAHEEIERLKGD